MGRDSTKSKQFDMAMRTEYGIDGDDSWCDDSEDGFDDNDIGDDWLEDSAWV